MLKRFSVTVSLLLVCMTMHCRADDQPIVLDATFTCRNPEARYGENIQFDVTITNSNPHPVQIEGFRIGRYLPVLWIKPEGGQWERFARDPLSGSDHLRMPMTLASGQTIQGAFLLRYLCLYFYKLQPGRYQAKIKWDLRSPSEQEGGEKRLITFNGLTEIPLNIKADEKDIVDVDAWIKHAREAYDNRNRGQEKTGFYNGYIQAYSAFLQNHPNSPMDVDIQIDIAMFTWLPVRDLWQKPEEQFQIAMKAKELSWAIAERDDALPLQKELALEMVLEYWPRRRKMLLPLMEAIRKLLELNPANSMATERVKQMQMEFARGDTQKGYDNFLRDFKEPDEMQSLIRSLEICMELLKHHRKAMENLSELHASCQKHYNECMLLTNKKDAE